MPDIIGLHPGAIAWRTDPDNTDPYQGQAAMSRRAGGGIELIVANGRTATSCVMSAEDAERLRQVLGGEDGGVRGLVVQLLQDSHERANHVTNQLLEAYQRERDEARAQLWALRHELEMLFSRGVMPTPDAIMRIVHEPDPALVQQSIDRANEGSLS